MSRIKIGIRKKNSSIGLGFTFLSKGDQIKCLEFRRKAAFDRPDFDRWQKKSSG
jgi:hypothetical protein